MSLPPVRPAAGIRRLTTVADAQLQSLAELLIDGVVGTVQLLLQQPENQRHRADLAKMLVHRRARRQGLGEALLRAAELLAVACDKSLLVLDTEAGIDAERLYARLGWQPAGLIPGYAIGPAGEPLAARWFFRRLAAD